MMSLVMMVLMVMDMHSQQTPPGHEPIKCSTDAGAYRYSFSRPRVLVHNIATVAAYCGRGVLQTTATVAAYCGLHPPGAGAAS